jgi:ClpX C4-type zinc finger
MTRRGAWIRACAAAVVNARTMELVVDPAIADLRHESASASRYFSVLKVVAICLWTGGAAMKCSFCRRPDSQVEKLVAGPWRILAGRVYICDRCAAQTIEIMEHSGNHPPHLKMAPLFRRIVRGLRALRRDDRHSHRAIVTPTA